MTGRPRRCGATAAIATIVALTLTSCGRSAPEGAVGSAGDGTEPVQAGIRVVSEQTVVPPAPTTVAPATTTAPATAPTTAPAPAGTYVVEAGDTLSVIAERFGITVDAISAANGITDVNTIRPGQELIIPAG